MLGIHHQNTGVKIVKTKVCKKICIVLSVVLLMLPSMALTSSNWMYHGVKLQSYYDQTYAARYPSGTFGAPATKINSFQAFTNAVMEKAVSLHVFYSTGTYASTVETGKTRRGLSVNSSNIHQQSSFLCPPPRPRSPLGAGDLFCQTAAHSPPCIFSPHVV